MGLFDHIVAKVNADEAENAARKDAEKKAEQRILDQLTSFALRECGNMLNFEVPEEKITFHPAEDFEWFEESGKTTQRKKSSSRVACTVVEGVTFACIRVSRGYRIGEVVHAVAKCDLCGALVWSPVVWCSTQNQGSLNEYYVKEAEKIIAQVVTTKPHEWGVDVPSSGLSATQSRHEKTCGKIRWTLTDSRSGACLPLFSRTEEQAWAEALNRLGYSLNRNAV